MKGLIKYTAVIYLIQALLILVGCKKFVEVPAPTTSLTSGNVYSDDATAAAVLTGLYTNLVRTSLVGTSPSINGISLLCGTSADELTVYGSPANANSTLVEYYQNNLNAGQFNDASSGGIWSNFYTDLYIVNLAYERLQSSTTLTPSVRQQLMGEARFMRAFFNFYLTNLYGNIPLALTSDYRTNSTFANSTNAEIYTQIIADLKEAQGLLTDGYVAADVMTSNSERVRPNKWAATALLARAYLYNKNYDSAEMQATAVINNSTLYDIISLNNVFLRNSREAIWQWQPVNTGWNTPEGQVFIIPSTGPTNNNSSGGYPVYLSPQLLGSFEPGDLRRQNWVDSVTVQGSTYYFPFKYKSATINDPLTEYSMILRLGEQYLIRAEARANGNNISGAQADLNLIRTRAGLPNATASGQNSLITAILHERQVELFTEWGHRWMDLKRTGTIDNVMNAVAPTKGASWNPNWQWYPIPAYDIYQDPNIKQNTGY